MRSVIKSCRKRDRFDLKSQLCFLNLLSVDLFLSSRLAKWVLSTCRNRTCNLCEVPANCFEPTGERPDEMLHTANFIAQQNRRFSYGCSALFGLELDFSHSVLTCSDTDYRRQVCVCVQCFYNRMRNKHGAQINAQGRL